MLVAPNYELRLEMPKCSPFAEKSTAKALLPNDVAEVLPYLNAVLPLARYLPNVPALTFEFEGHHVSLSSRQMLLGGCTGEEEARGVLESLRTLINDTWERRAEIEPDHTAYEEMTALQALRLLPGTNCRKCGEAACLPFAMKLVARQAPIEACEPLFEAGQEGKRGELLAELLARGYEVPTV